MSRNDSHLPDIWVGLGIPGYGVVTDTWTDYLRASDKSITRDNAVSSMREICDSKLQVMMWLCSFLV